MSSATHDAHTRRILDKLAESESISQRSLSRDLGIALGLTNLLVRRLVAKGWIRMVAIRPRHIRYVLTPAGMAQKARLSREYLMNSVRFYSEARDRVQRRFVDLLTETPPDRCRSVVFYGAGEVAEVGWVCIQRSPLRLVGVVDDERAGTEFFGQIVHPSSVLTPTTCNSVPYDRVIVMGAEPSKSTLALDRQRLPAERIFWL